MNKIKEFWAVVSGKGEKLIYRRILRAALWGSFITFISMAFISLCAMFILHNVMIESGERLSSNVGDYLEDTIENGLRHHMMETTVLKSRYAGRLLKGCAVNVEFLANKMTEILQNKEEHVKKRLPIANYVEIPDNIPYLYYAPSLIKNGIPYALSEEIAYASSINVDMKRITHRYYNNILIASKNGYMIRMDMIENDDKGAVLGYEPLRSSYDFIERNWYKQTQRENKLIYTDPYFGTNNRPCISVCAPYYDAEGFAGAVAVDIDTNYIYERIKQAGASDDDDDEFTFIMGRNGAIIISPKKDGIFSVDLNVDLRNASNKELADTAKKMTEGEEGITLIKIDGSEYYLSYAPLADTGLVVGVIMDKAFVTESSDKIENYTMEIISEYKNGLYKFFFIMTVVGVILFIGVLWFIIRENIKRAKEFAKPIKILTDGAAEIAKGNLNKKITVNTGDELEMLADTFNGMTKDLSAYMDNLAKTAAEKERIETELSVGTKIQAGMLPDGDEQFKDRNDFDLAALMHPAREVGGDFYDFYLLDENHLVITVADVSDKGVPAALFMVIAKTLLKETLVYANDAQKLGEVFENANESLTQSNKANMFVTVFTGILNLHSGEFIYANAGHNPPIIKSGGECKYLEKAVNPILGAVEGLRFKTVKLVLNPGDALFLYTDGVTEARNKEQDFFGEERLIKTAEKFGNDAKADIESAYKAVKEYVAGASQSDDITMLEVIYRGRT